MFSKEGDDSCIMNVSLPRSNKPKSFGGASIEMAALIACIAIVVIASVSQLGENINMIFDSVPLEGAAPGGGFGIQAGE